MPSGAVRRTSIERVQPNNERIVSVQVFLKRSLYRSLRIYCCTPSLNRGLRNNEADARWVRLQCHVDAHRRWFQCIAKPFDNNELAPSTGTEELEKRSFNAGPMSVRAEHCVVQPPIELHRSVHSHGTNQFWFRSFLVLSKIRCLARRNDPVSFILAVPVQPCYSCSPFFRRNNASPDVAQHGLFAQQNGHKNSRARDGDGDPSKVPLAWV